MTLGEIMIEFREKMGWSQREFARKSNLSHGSVYLLELGENPQTGKKIEPSVSTLKKIAETMNMTIEQLTKKIDANQVISLNPANNDIDRLEALHQNPKLRMLFDRSRKMSESDIDLILQMADRILGEGEK